MLAHYLVEVVHCPGKLSRAQEPLVRRMFPTKAERIKESLPNGTDKKIIRMHSWSGKSGQSNPGRRFQMLYLAFAFDLHWKDHSEGIG